MTATSLQLVTGPARSGKSRWAEHLAGLHRGPVTYVATAGRDAADPVWEARLRAHRLRRPPTWELLECGERLPEALQQRQPGHLLLVDALGTWVAWGLDLPEPAWTARCDGLMAALRQGPGPTILVSEQTGWGVVPPTAIGGLFRDRLGRLEQDVAGVCDRVWLVVAGRAVDLTATGVQVPS